MPQKLHQLCEVCARIFTGEWMVVPYRFRRHVMFGDPDDILEESGEGATEDDEEWEDEDVFQYELGDDLQSKI